MKARRASPFQGGAGGPLHEGLLAGTDGKSKGIIRAVRRALERVTLTQWLLIVVIVLLVVNVGKPGQAPFPLDDGEELVAGSSGTRRRHTPQTVRGATYDHTDEDVDGPGDDYARNDASHDVETDLVVEEDNNAESDGENYEDNEDAKRDQPKPSPKLSAHDAAALRAAERSDSSAAVAGGDLTQLSDEELFENAAEFSAAPDVFVPDVPAKRGEWWGVRTYAELYKRRPIKRFIPILKRNIQLTPENFRERFRRIGQPVLFRFENLQSMGFTMKAFSMEELREMFPFRSDMDGKTFGQYRPNGRFQGDEVDLGPGLAAIANDGAIVRKNGLRNFPRNMKVKPAALRRLGVMTPPLIPSRWRQAPALWMGTSSSGTAFHSDCCDNFVAMIAGTKRFTLAPPSDFHLLNPRCVGKNKGLCYANIPEPNAPGVPSGHYNKMIVDINPGEMLYMPAGWFHHVANAGPVLMTNFWSYGQETAGVVSCNRGSRYP